MNTENYSIESDRQHTEIALANALINENTLVQHIDPEHFKLPLVKKVHDYITISHSKGEITTNESIKHRLLVLAGTNVSPETMVSLSTICQVNNRSIDEFNELRDHLYQISAREKVVNLSEAIASRAKKGDDIRELCIVAEDIATTKDNFSKKLKVTSIGDALESTMFTMNNERETGGTTGKEFHITKLNRVIGGMFPTDLIVVAARPAVGKTAWGLNVVHNCPNAVFGFISSEMSNEQLSKRLIASETGIDSFKLRKPHLLSEKEFSSTKEAASKLKGRKIYLEDKGKINIAEVRDCIEEWVKYYGVEIVVLDYIQRIESDRRHNNKAEEVGYIAKRVKEIAKEFGICIIALAQINRDAAKDNRPPTMADIKASGDIEQEADIIILLHKRSMGTDEANFDCIVEAIVEKNRHGSIGIVLMNYSPSLLKFADPTEDQKDEYLMNYAA
ncbi:putative SF4 helicase domain-containing protein [Vibrio chagasii]|nr:putative SF4 helicase domain-containing protein [Vibrio chagasii]